MQKERMLKSLKKALILVLVGLAYYGVVKLTGWGLPCPFHLLTGWHCPGCGISRMFMALLELDFMGALGYNALVLVLLPFGVVFGLRRWIIYVKTGNTAPDRLETVLLIVATVLTLAFWILRNLPQFSFLAPGA
jgi:hypothetical protein